jgi:hypothetical protein
MAIPLWPYATMYCCCCFVQANVWMAIFGFIGNYFWTHYFFNLLGAAYTLPSHRLNGVRGVTHQQAHCLGLHTSC